MLTEDLHCALIEIMGFGENRRHVVLFEQEVLDAIVRQKAGEAKAATTAAHDDDRNINYIRHVLWR